MSEPGSPLGRHPKPAAEVPHCAAVISPFAGDTSTRFSFLLPFAFLLQHDAGIGTALARTAGISSNCVQRVAGGTK